MSAALEQSAIYAWEAAPPRMAGCFRLWNEVPETEKDEWRAIAKAATRADTVEELYEALEGATHCIEAFGVKGGGLATWKALLAKARGEQVSA